LVEPNKRPKGTKKRETTMSIPEEFREKRLKSKKKKKKKKTTFLGRAETLS